MQWWPFLFDTKSLFLGFITLSFKTVRISHKVKKSEKQRPYLSVFKAASVEPNRTQEECCKAVLGTWQPSLSIDALG